MRLKTLHMVYRLALTVLLILIPGDLVSQGGGDPNDRLDAQRISRSLIGMQYTASFTDASNSWDSAESIPVVGKYSSDAPEALDTHFRWFQQMGIDWILVDWTSLVWSDKGWQETSSSSSKNLNHNIDILFEHAMALRRTGKYAPRIVLELGLRSSKDAPAEMKHLNEAIEWIGRKYLDRPDYSNLWMYYDGKPLLVIYYAAKDPCNELPSDLHANPLESSRWTVRWMSTQLQENHADQCGLWSWMDGDIHQIVTKRDGKSEELVVTPAAFGTSGWLNAGSVGRDHGVPYLESWRQALIARPKFIQIHQWNEFAGTKDDGATFYGDEYNEELSDDIEPTVPDGCGLRSCGGWGFLYVNLTRAIVSLYRGETPDITVLALSPSTQDKVAGARYVNLHWSVVGSTPSGYSIFRDGRLIGKENAESTAYRLDVSDLSSGRHKIKVVANGAKTYFDLDARKMTRRSTKSLPVQAEVEIDK